MERTELKQARRDMGLNQAQMAARLGISLSHYKNIEAGVFDPSYKVMERFAEEFPKCSSKVWLVFKKADKKKIRVIKEPIFVDEIKVKTDWGD